MEDRMKSLGKLGIFLGVYLGIAALLLIPAFIQAAPITIDTSQWIEDLSPSSNRLSQNDGWTRLATNTPTRPSNASGSLLSDFRLTGDFSFSGSFSPIVDRRPGSSCDQNGNAICNDNDILGLVFGWQDPSNHYRLGFGQGGDFAVSDVTGRQGLFLVREANGVSDTLFSWDTSYWVDDANYSFNVTRSANELSVSVSGLVRSSPGSQSASQAIVADLTATDMTLSRTVIDDLFLDGRIGVYTESQASEFSDLRVNGVVAVSAPATATLMFVVATALARRQRKSLASGSATPVQISPH